MNAVAQRAAARIAVIEQEIKRFMDSAVRRSEMDGVRRRRQRVRYHRSWPLAVFDPNQMPGTCVAAALHNASNQGIAFLTHRQFDIGATVLIRLFWHDDQSPKAPAVIRHVTPTVDGYLIGCEFDPCWCRREPTQSGTAAQSEPVTEASRTIHANLSN